MSDMTGPTPVGALHGASYDGYVRIAEEPMRGMITLRGDLSGPLAKGATTVTGLDMPGPREVTVMTEKAIAWMSPDELMVMVPLADLPAALETLDTTLRDPFATAVDVSQARSIFSITGPDALVREVVAKLAPVDMDPQQFRPGMFRRTRLAQVPAALWLPAPGRVELICFRSVADYVFTILADAAKPGSEAGLFA
ncbi:sarcosine oxidase subunit gamma [Pseudooceanicola sediminis]|uniref:Sarcosine oxidase subunit gamma n=1 Tax=Pseudooceanicola sediminis TaxID=2211117 RepID=A0A399J018_9RHOB|nr:sarcosine oxidase subunit gamma family protein [Pseudooceanicola sediminis]KAA2312714.1 sarcosine oxidase subunit gamma [Puniceibacterium sp. HSS470]RII38007.1 sarcosine oxidase subunit gamma [Pseudooceanicola sediminis]|tara:strand:+ start:32097 stop:32684 length:588 start_codon:yes stop_codon:yes gene_type:complete